MHVHMSNEPQVQFLLGLKLAFLPCSFKAKVYLEVGEVGGGGGGGKSQLENFKGQCPRHDIS